MIWTMSASLIPSGSSAGLFVSTMTTFWPLATPLMISGFFRVPFLQDEGGFGVGFAQKLCLGRLLPVLGQIPGPDDGRAGRIRCPGDLWPKTRVVMGDVRSEGVMPIAMFRAPYRQGRGALVTRAAADKRLILRCAGSRQGVPACRRGAP